MKDSFMDDLTGKNIFEKIIIFEKYFLIFLKYLLTKKMLINILN